MIANAICCCLGWCMETARGSIDTRFRASRLPPQRKAHTTDTRNTQQTHADLTLLHCERKHPWPAPYSVTSPLMRHALRCLVAAFAVRRARNANNVGRSPIEPAVDRGQKLKNRTFSVRRELEHFPFEKASLRASVFTCIDEHERGMGAHEPHPGAVVLKSNVEGERSKKARGVKRIWRRCSLF